MALFDQLDHLETFGVIRLARIEPELEYLFRHALVQEAAYSSLLQDDRKRLHQSVGLVMEQLYPERREELAATLAHHFSSADDNRRAFKYLVLAGDVAFRQYAIPEAISHYSRALELSRQDIEATPEPILQQIYTHLGRALELDAQYERALELYAEMESLARERDNRAIELTAVMEQAKIHSTPNPAYNADYGQALSERALQLACQLNDRPAEARIHWILMMLNWLRGEQAQMLPHGERSLALARQLDAPDQLAYTLQDIHRAYLYDNQMEQAKSALDQARELWRDLGNLPMLADNLASAADLAAAKGDYDQALAFADEAVQLSQSIGNLWNHAYGRQVAGEVYLHQGLMDQALPAIQEAIELSDRAGLVILHRRALLVLAWAYGLLGAQPLVRQTLEQLRTRYTPGSESLFDSPIEIDTAWYKAWGELGVRNLDAADAILQRGLRLLEEQDRTSWLRLLVQAKLALEQGEAARSLTLIDRFLDNRPPGVGFQNFLLVGQTIKGRASLESGNVQQAGRVLYQALDTGQALQARYDLWGILASLSELESRRGNASAAAKLRRQAQATITDIADHVSAPELRAAFLDRSDVREILASE